MLLSHPHSRIWRHLLCLATLALFLLPRAHAAPILWIDDSTGALGKVDVATGAVTLIGNTGPILLDIAFDPTGKLYGLDLNHLYTIDTTTAVSTMLPTSTFPFGGNALVFSSTGTLYGAGATKFATLNPATGAATIVGNIGPGLNSGGDLAFIGGNLYLTASNNHLLRINPATGAGTDVGSFGPGVTDIFGLAAVSNTLYGVSGTRIYTIDPTTGAASFVLDYAGHGLADAFGAAFIGEAGFNPGGGGGGGAPLPRGAGTGLLAAAIAWAVARLAGRRGGRKAPDSYPLSPVLGGEG
jgi:hypothetical protein